MLVLAFDPGDNTGFAVVDSHYTNKMSGTFDLDGIQFWPNFLRNNFDITHLVIEAPPQHTRGGQKAWHMIRQELKIKFPKLPIYEASPGHWKPLRHNFIREGDTFSTDHEKDAVHLARYRVRQVSTSRLRAEA